MADKAHFEYPKANEKLSYKFILDSLKDEMLWNENPEASAIETMSTTMELKPVEQAEIEEFLEPVPLTEPTPIKELSKKRPYRGPCTAE